MNIGIPIGAIVIAIALYYGIKVNMKARGKRDDRMDRLKDARQAYLDSLLKKKTESNTQNNDRAEHDL